MRQYKIIHLNIKYGLHFVYINYMKLLNNIDNFNL
jgi:hypothetical protein